jgi:hypothetical protein
LLETLPSIIITVLQRLGLQNWEEKILDIKQA